ncbi:hypothetical protein VNI00_015452 [Paramarasmius palmivorus]|uniref:Fungal-type protein kinase domain-containing protein n=1 Tax=Paramarasmius palmivorus TaxID=297713 RepID=A0AAW0BKA1_9AGAR
MASNSTLKTLNYQTKSEFPNNSRKNDPTCHPGLGTAELDVLRPALMHSMGVAVPEVEIDWFLQHAIPRFSPERRYVSDLQVLGSVMTGLRSSIVKGRWKWYKKDPSKMQAGEDTVFKHMESISDAVLQVGKQFLSKTKSTSRLRCLSRQIGKSEMENSNFKGDANQLMEETTGAGMKGKNDYYIVDSVVNYAFKKLDDIETVNINVVQLLGNAARILFIDPLRRFRWSVSVENTTMRFWFLSRSVCFVSKPFNFVTQHKPFVHFLLATSFASKTDLGYDPTVRRTVVTREGKNAVVYDYMIYDTKEDREIWYRTVGEVISNYRAHRLLGRAIRVWVVQELNNKGVPFGNNLVLKDYWITLDSLTEGQIQSRIFEAAARARGNKEFKKYFMTILHDTIVTIDGEEDSSPLHLGGEAVPMKSRFCLKKEAARNVPRPHIDFVHSESTGGNDVPVPEEEESDNDDPKHEHHLYEPRKHARLVFKEVGTCLNMIKDQKTLFRCLIDALCGLETFYDARWVHRDISTGNLLLCYDDNKQPICKISDLEYARPHLSEVPTGAPELAHKTGTPAFMAVEVQLKEHLFCEPTDPSAGTKVPVLHNYLHDVESVWWIAMWHLFHTYPVREEDRCISNVAVKNIRKQQEKAHAIFPASVDGSMKRWFFVERLSHYKEGTNILLHNQLFSRTMGVALLKLHEYYKLVEVPIENTLEHDLFAGVHRAMVPFFEQARDVGVEVEYSEYFRRRTRAEAAKKDDSAVGQAVAGGSGVTVRAGVKGKKRTQTDAELGTSSHKRRK